jgi:hypothetical protein
MVAIVAAGAFAPILMDKWTLKPDMEPKSKTTYAVVVNVEQGGQPHEAKLTMLREVKSADTKEAKVDVTWKDITLDDQPIGEDRTFPLTATLRGGLTSSAGEFGDDERRMLSPFAFVYPESAVDVGDKWSFENKPTGGTAHTVSYEVKAIEKIGEQDAMKIAFKLDEKEDLGEHAEGTFWVAKSGRVLRWDMKVKNWIVPMAGPPMDANIKGEFVPEKK